MRRFRRWLLSAPLYVQFLYFATTFALATYGLDAVLSGDRGGWIVHAIGGAMYGAVMTGIFAWRRRKDGGASQQLALATALKSGRLPPDADPQVWGPLLEAKQRSFRRWRPWGIAEFAAFTALAVALAITEGAVWWAFAAFFLGMGIWIVVGGRRNERRIASLRESLPESSPAHD